MSFVPRIFPAILILACASCASAPSVDKAAAAHRDQAASFIARTAYAKAGADPDIYGGKGGVLSCIVYTVTQGAASSPGYTMVVATDTSYAPMDDIILLCDTVAVDPAHSIVCSGHVLYVQGGWITTGGDGMTVQFGLGKKDRVFKITGKRQTVPM